MPDQLMIVETAPYVLRADDGGRGILAALELELRKLDALFVGVKKEIGRDIDSMREELLDELAWERFVTWYDDTADIGVKRAVIRDAMKVHARMGTLWAVQQVVAEYFPQSEIIEWWAYGGEPYHFAVLVEDLRATKEQAALLRRVVERVKNVRSVMEAVYILLGVAWEGGFGASLGVGEILDLKEG